MLTVVSNVHRDSGCSAFLNPNLHVSSQKGSPEQSQKDPDLHGFEAIYLVFISSRKLHCSRWWAGGFVLEEKNVDPKILPITVKEL